MYLHRLRKTISHIKASTNVYIEQNLLFQLFEFKRNLHNHRQYWGRFESQATQFKVVSNDSSEKIFPIAFKQKVNRQKTKLKLLEGVIYFLIIACFSDIWTNKCP